jgi:hypothetical protein
MVKNVIIGILFLGCVSMFFFGLVQRTEAMKWKYLSEQQTALAVMIAEQTIQECSKKKR